MKRYILFSQPSPELIDKIAPLLFPTELEHKVMAYMPSDGLDKISIEKYMPFWKDLAAKFGVSKFNFIDNSIADLSEKQKLQESNILLITGGNTFTLLNNIRESGLDKEILALANKENFVIAGFSAGAAILTPTINIITSEWAYGKDDNKVGLDDLTGLNLVDFEVLPHYEDSDSVALSAYRKQSVYEVKPITNSEYIVVEK